MAQPYPVDSCRTTREAYHTGVLEIGSKAPDFNDAVLEDGSRFSLSTALEYGPVVLYFFLWAFTAG